jgi:sugar phosphate isomerase/epimerase
MRYTPFGVSNLAWPSSALEEALPILRRLGCDAIEIAPFAVFRRWGNVVDDVSRLRDLIERHGLVCSALQGILHGVTGAELFNSESCRTRLLRHLEYVADLAGLLGARACVFGAPRQRDPGDLSPGDAWKVAVETLRRIGPAFAARGTTLAFEPNAGRYGCRFVTTTEEAARLVIEVATPGIGLQIDTGTFFLEGESPTVLMFAAPIAVHAHISEPDLRPPGLADHGPIAASLRLSNYRGSLSMEMKQHDDWRTTMEAAIRFVQANYT